MVVQSAGVAIVAGTSTERHVRASATKAVILGTGAFVIAVQASRRKETAEDEDRLPLFG
jgi:hypothetical protein